MGLPGRRTVRSTSSTTRAARSSRPDTGDSGSLLASGLTIVARWRIHPAPRDLDAARGQELSQARGQISFVYQEGRRRENLFLSLFDDRLHYPGGSVAVEADAFLSVWATIEAEGEEHRLRLYVDGSEAPLVDGVVSLPRSGTEVFTANYLAVGLANGTQAGAIQLDFVGYRRGVAAPTPAAGARRFSRGDADGDGELRVADAVRVLESLPGWTGAGVPRRRGRGRLRADRYHRRGPSSPPRDDRCSVAAAGLAGVRYRRDGGSTRLSHRDLSVAANRPADSPRRGFRSRRTESPRSGLRRRADLPCGPPRGESPTMIHASSWPR